MLGVWRTVRAALPQVVERKGHIVVTGSVYSFVNGIFNSPYAVAKAGVESLGREPAGRAGAAGGERDRRLLGLDRHAHGPDGPVPTRTPTGCRRGSRPGC